MAADLLYANFEEKPTLDVTKPIATVENKDGSISTVRTISFQDESGLEVVIPTVHKDGYIMSNKEAINHYYDTGEHLGKFKTVQEAVDFSKSLHDLHDNLYSK